MYVLQRQEGKDEKEMVGKEETWKGRKQFNQPAGDQVVDTILRDELI